MLQAHYPSKKALKESVGNPYVTMKRPCLALNSRKMEAFQWLTIALRVSGLHKLQLKTVSLRK